jgi:hypothetical protein
MAPRAENTSGRAYSNAGTALWVSARDIRAFAQPRRSSDRLRGVKEQSAIECIGVKAPHALLVLVQEELIDHALAGIMPSLHLSPLGCELTSQNPAIGGETLGSTSKAARPVAVQARIAWDHARLGRISRRTDSAGLFQTLWRTQEIRCLNRLAKGMEKRAGIFLVRFDVGVGVGSG